MTVLVLCYHALSATWPAPLAVTPEHFERQIGHLAARGYRGQTFTDAVRRPDRHGVAITFDDAFRSVLEVAGPILDRHGFPATVFAPTAHMESGGPLRWAGIEQWLSTEHRDELRALTWDHLGELAERGWEIGSHTRTHPVLPELGDEELAAELEGSREDCERRLGRPCRSVAYPYGRCDVRVADAAAAAGYAAGAALPVDLDPAGPLRWPRIGVYRRDGQPRFRAKVSWPGRRLRAGRGRRLMRAARHLEARAGPRRSADE